MGSTSIPITLWPATPILPPALVNRQAWDYRDAFDAPVTPELRPLPDEWVLRDMFDTDLDDDGEIERLLKDHGRISWPYADRGMVPPARRQFLAPAEATDEENTDLDGRRHDGTLEDARWWLKTLRSLVGMWRLASFGRNPADAWAAEGFLSHDEPTAWLLFTGYLNAGLEPFRARAFIRWEGPEIEGIFPVELYSAACQQLFNFIVSGATARRCENATCGRTFVHQLGGEGSWQRSKGLRYCTPECARAEAQRQYRRRKKAETLAEKPRGEAQTRG